MTLAVGDMAPDFTLPSTASEPVTLSALRGQTVVLFFYPKDSTPGCTTQACAYRDLRADFEARGARIFGVSRDSLKAHTGFIGKQGLNYPLLTDADGAVHRLYGAWGEKKMYGKTVEGVLRSSVVVGPDGRIRRLAHSVKAADDAAATLASLG